jgi:hypothetical protein
MSQPGTEVIPFKVYENLGLIFQAPKGRSMNDPISVSLKSRPVIRFVIQVGPALAIPAAHAIWSKALILNLLELLTIE